MAKKKKSATTVNSEAVEDDESAVIESVEVEGDAVATTSSSSTSNSSEAGDRELQETPVPKCKAAGKRSSEKSEFQGRLLDLLERDMQASKSNSLAQDDDDDDTVDLQLMSMSKRIKKELPAQERFTVLQKFQQVLNDYIESVNRHNLINATPLRQEAGQSFLQMGNQEAVIQTPALLPSPPMLQQQPQVQTKVPKQNNVPLPHPPMLQQQQHQQPQAQMTQLQKGTKMYGERTLRFEDL